MPLLVLMNPMKNCPYPLEWLSVARLQYHLASHHILGDVSEPSLTLSPCVSMRLLVHSSPVLFYMTRHRYMTGASRIRLNNFLCPYWFKDFAYLLLPQIEIVLFNVHTFMFFTYCYILQCWFVNRFSKHPCSGQTMLLQSRGNAIIVNLPSHTTPTTSVKWGAQYSQTPAPCMPAGISTYDFLSLLY